MKFAAENSFEVKQKISEKQIAILPIGAIEAHGPHLPLETDNLLAERLSILVAKRVGAFVLPTLPYGQVWSLKNFPGSITVSNESLVNMLVDLGESLYNQGFSIFSMVNGHLGNSVALKEAARKLYERYPDLQVLYFFYPGMSEVVSSIRETPSSHNTYFHACEIETSLMLYLAPEYVDMERAICDIPVIPLSADATPTPWEEFTDTAVLGDATLAIKEKGEKVISVVLDNIVQVIEEVRRGVATYKSND
ncbi:creatininase family protein [Halalkalibacterium halodurans]|uniref:Creatinine amidohydrolase n=2 Tax=Halalkalibacterium halodurans TaxID=86665 RepID=A0A0M0KE16_ALKHA|nr:creatininase family protein [Halalkalibacterium halodurans]MDY7220733.1 creatininase family protein [Halalkalibacterium halodurans]MDY7239972.1 creatininase family protein [Halalkalibacterium halodurans]TPE67381.1 creatininase family protein [Halalkalibacterium halodurans]